MMKRVTMNLLQKNLFSTIYLPFARPLSYIWLQGRLNINSRKWPTGGGREQGLLCKDNHLPGRGGLTIFRGSTPVWNLMVGSKKNHSKLLMIFVGNCCKEHVMTSFLRPFQFSKNWSWGGREGNLVKIETSTCWVKIENFFSHFFSSSKNWKNWRGHKKQVKHIETIKYE